MDTVQLQCGHCKKVMAISAAHLGQQVQCPHCRSVVQTPAPQPAAEMVAMPGAANVGPTQSAAAADAAAPGMSPISATMSAPNDATAPMDPAAPFSPAGSVQAPPPDDDFSQFKPKPRRDRSVFLVMALIFLVPYALTMTFFVIFLLMFRQGESDPLKYLPDPMPSDKKGGPRPAQRMQPPHDAALAAERKTPLGKSVKIGDLLVTPQRVLLTAEGDLKLLLRARNVAAKTAFEPMSDFYVNDRLNTTKPYTYLEMPAKNLEKIYGGYLAYHKNPQGKDEPQGFAVLAPNEEITIALMTREAYRAKHVSAITKSEGEDCTWRVQLRRGFVKKNGKDVSATTVIGVEFSSKQIEREG